MTDKIFVKPARPGLIVRDPVTGERLADEGQEKEANSYWVRRLKFGDVIEIKPAAKAVTQSKPKGKED